MFYTPDYYHNISIRLSEVLDDIGVNEIMGTKRRKAALLRETMETIRLSAGGKRTSVYILGSQSEGTTTIGLRSDTDSLICLDDYIVIQDWSEWTPGKGNFLMIQNETTPPGYCSLQLLRPDAPLPVTHGIGGNFSVSDTSGRILLKNTIIDAIMQEGQYRQGPSAASAAQPGILARDIVLAYPCKAWPKSSRVWLDQQETNTWPTAEMKRYAKSTKSVVVGVGSRASENAAFEWRLSTSLVEQCFMINLNITQIRIYILMKMILKTYINAENPDNESYISSFMCKTVLFFCIASKPSFAWKKCNILNCLTFCIQTLNRCVLEGNCPHFFDHGNNLMAGKISTVVKHQLLERMSKLIPCDEISLFGIQIDDLGGRLQMKLNMINEIHLDLLQPDEYTMHLTAALILETTIDITSSLNKFFHSTKDESIEMKLKILLQTVFNLTRHYRAGNMIEKTACRLLAPLYCTSIGSLITSQNFQTNNTVSPQALAWLEAGQDSDVASSRLKLASIMYCTGDMGRVAFILNNIEEQYNTEVTEPICGCYNFHWPCIKERLGQLCCQYVETELKYFVAFCIIFFPAEISCVPHELQYEMFRSTQEDLLHRGGDDDWMDCAVVDSLPYLYFLQYKTYRNLQRPQEQQLALNKLMNVIRTEHNLAHRETALNLLGQCMEQENRPVDALQCYMLSLRFRERNNAAKIHICMCLANTIS